MNDIKKSGIIKADDQAPMKNSRESQLFDDTFIETGSGEESNISNVESARYGMPYISLDQHDVYDDLLKLVPKELALRHRFFPLDKVDSVLTIVMDGSLDKRLVEKLKKATSCTVLCYFSPASEIIDAIKKHYSRESIRTEGDKKQRPKPDRRTAGTAAEQARLAAKSIMVRTARRMNIPPLDLSKFKPIPEVVKLIPRQMAARYRVIPVARLDNTLSLAMVEPQDFMAIDDLMLATGLEVRPIVCSDKDFREALEKCYPLKANMEELLRGTEEPEFVTKETDHLEQEIKMDDLIKESGESSVVKIVNFMLVHAIKNQASDIHIEPYRNTLRLRYRIDGMLHDSSLPPKHIHAAIVSRIKIMANLDIAERRRPQDGSFRIKLEGREIDFRVSCMTSVFGEKIVLRVLDKSSIASLSLDRLGFHQKGLDEFRKAITSPYGIVLLTGPTGSGKTTTLYTAMQEINKPEINIVSVEDPVEYQIQGINQFETKPGIGLDFARILRSIVRQDPDIIMIGEIRDFETADIAIKAALTGHLVLSTLHTNDAASAITRLYDMGIEPFLISSSTLLCAAQRLIRCLCHHCRKETKLPAEVLERSQMKLNSSEKPELYHAVGCPACKHTGYSGRMALIETITIDDDIRDMIMRRASAQQLKQAAIEKGMKTLRMVGLERVKDGSTTLEEVLRITSSD